MDLSMRQFENVSFMVIGLGPMGSPLTLIGAVASIPILYFVVNRIVGLKNMAQTLIFYSITLLSGILFWWIRLSYLKSVTEHSDLGTNMSNNIVVDKLNFETYFWFGIVLGAVLCLVTFRIVNQKYRAKSRSDTLQTVDLIDQND
ncbi:MAG: hypothetical protein ACI8XB_002971 [Patiriisocius sp.]|jgi:hypothetical protein